MARPMFRNVRLPHTNRDGEGEGTTQLMNLRSKNLFEVYNAAEIVDEAFSNLNDSDQIQGFDPSNVTVKSIILDDTCFICINQVVHCFKVGSVADNSVSFELEDSLSDICVVPGQKIIMFLLQNGSICFFIPEQSKLTSTLNVFDGNADNYKASFGGFGQFLCLCVLATYGSHCEAKFLKFMPFSQIIQGSTEFLNATRILKTSERLNLCFVTGDKFGFAFFPKDKNIPIMKQCAYTLHFKSSDETLVQSYSLPYGVQSVHKVGKLIGVLTNSLECIFFNSLEDLVPAGLLQLGGFRGEILDFAILDFDGTVLSKDNRMVVHIDNGNKHKILLTDVQSSVVAFEFESSPYICLNSYTAQTELNNNVVIVESFSDKRPNSVQLRFVFEAEPATRLRNLLERRRFEEALDCARVYKLPLNGVYEKQIAFLIEGINTDGRMSNEELDKLLALLRNLAATHEEIALDYAFLAVTASIEYAHIQKLLSFCDKCHTNDESLIENIDRLKYALESYSSLFGPQASYAADSYWPHFWTHDNHWELFEKMLSESKIDKCSELWNRYRVSLSQQLVDSTEQFFPDLLKYLERTIAGSRGSMCYKISLFLEKDLLPPFFTEQNLKHLVPFQSELMDFFKRVALSLWQLDQQNFPKNACDFSSTIARIVDNLSKESRNKKLIVRCLNDMGIGSMDLSSSYVELNRVVVKLKHLQHLKETYNFVSSYEAYHNLTAEEIGNLLLDKIYTIANNIAYVKDTVFRFCEEVGLDRDTLLLNYIKKADLSKIANICIGMCKLFKNDDFRAEAAMLIAPNFALPWSKDLTEMFDNLRAIQSLPEMTQQQLKETELRAQISVIMKNYSGGFMLDILDSHDIIDFCTTLFAHNEVPTEKRVQDAQQICRISMQNSKIVTLEADCFVSVIKRAFTIARSVQELNQTLNIFGCLKDLDLLQEVAKECASFAYCLLSSKNILDKSIPLCANFLIRVAQYLPNDLKASYVKKAASICQLYELCQVVVFANKLNNIEETSKILCSIADFNEGEEPKSIYELLEIGELLLLTKEDTIIQLILHFAQKEQVGQVEEILGLIPSLIDELNSDVLIEAIYYGLSLMFRYFSNQSWSVLDVEKLSEFASSIKDVTSLVFKHTKNEAYLTMFSSILEYIQFVEDALSICKYVDFSSSNATMITEENTVLSDEEEAFLDLELRLKLPIYGVGNEPKSGNLNTIIQNVCKVAESVCQPIDYLKSWQTMANALPGTYRTQWISLITLLGNQQLDLLALSAAQICLRMKLFDEHQDEILVLYDKCVVKLLERQLATLNVDWISAIENMSFRGAHQSSTIVRTLRELPEIVRNRVLVVNSYLLKFMFPENVHTNIQGNLLQFQKLSWQRELAIYGLNISSKVIDAPDRFLDHFIEHLISPSIIVSLCRSFNRDFDMTLLCYAINLCISHSTKKTQKRNMILQCASEALNLIQNPTVEVVRRLLLSIDQRFSPYDYESIELALDWCQKHVNDTDLSDWVGQMQKLIAFLRIHKRRATITQQELDWFANRSTHHQKNERAAKDINLSMDGVPAEKAIPIEQDPLQFSLLRLPFQVFLATDEQGKSIAREIVVNQVTTETLQEWIALAVELPRLLPYTRVFLESSSICADLRRCLERRMVCDKKLMLRVLSIIHFNRNMVSILRHVSSELSSVVQSEHKVKVFEQLTSLLDQRLKQAKTSETEFANSSDLEQAQGMYKSLVNGRNAFFVLNLLAKYNLLNSKTSNLSGNVLDLCKHIFSRITNWNDLDEIASHVNFVCELDKQGLISVRDVFDKIIFDWLKNFDFDQNLSDMTLDLSMETDGDASNEKSAAEAIPYFSPEVTRMAFFLKHRCNREIAEQIKSLQFLSQKGAESKFRVSCVVLRAFDESTMNKLFGTGKDTFF